MRKRGLLGISFPVLIFAILAALLFIVAFLSGPVGKSLFPGIRLPAWISVPQPEPRLPAEEIFSLFGFPITNSIVGAWITIAFLVVVSWAVTHRMKLVPGRLQAAFEFLVGWVYDLCVRVAGEKNGRRFFPVVGTIFLFVAFNSWLSLLPGYGSITVLDPAGENVPLLRGANTDINVPLALALASFFFVAYFGLRDMGLRYLAQFFNVGPLFKSIGQAFKGHFNATELITGVINIGVGLLELLSQFIRIVSFTFRLFGNMTAGEILLLIVAFLVPWTIGVAFYVLELIVGFVQALIFSGLTLVFLTLATAGHGGEHHAETGTH